MSDDTQTPDDHNSPYMGSEGQTPSTRGQIGPQEWKQFQKTMPAFDPNSQLAHMVQAMAYMRNREGNSNPQ